jgi:hypothetical protein
MVERILVNRRHLLNKGEGLLEESNKKGLNLLKLRPEYLMLIQIRVFS